MPAKTTINLVPKNEKQIKPYIAIWPILLIVLLAAAFGKFCVADRFIAASRASGKVAQLRNDLNNAYARLNEFQDVEDQYAHYTYSGLTEEELSRVDRVEIMRLLNKAFDSGYSLRGWTVSGNMMKMQMTGTSLRELNALSQTLELEPIVDQCVIQTADRKEKVEAARDVEATFIVYLQGPEQPSQETAQEGTAAETAESMTEEAAPPAQGGSTTQEPVSEGGGAQ